MALRHTKKRDTVWEDFSRSSEDILTLTRRNSSPLPDPAPSTSRQSQRKRHSIAPGEVDFSDAVANNILQHPDVVSIHRTPGVFKFRRRMSSEPKIDLLSIYPLPRHVLHNVFGNLNKRDLCNAMRACRNFYFAGVTSKNWDYLDLYNRTLPSSALMSILQRRVKVVRLSEARVDDVRIPLSPTISPGLPFSLALTHLDLGRTSFANRECLIEILSACTKLRGLCLEAQLFDNSGRVGVAIGQNKLLNYLDLSMVRGISVHHLTPITSGCRNLEQLNVSWCGLDEQCVQHLCSELTSTLTHLNMAGTLNKIALQDADVVQLVVTCPYLIEVDFSDNIHIGDTSLEALTELQHLQTMSINRCYGISPPNLLTCDFLQALNVIGCLTPDGDQALQLGLPGTKINGSIFNFIAKPTVPPSVSSIWLQRTKDIYL